VSNAGFKMKFTSQKIEAMREENDVLGLLNANGDLKLNKHAGKIETFIESALIDIGKKNITPFIKLINEKDVVIRRGVYWSLMKIRDTDTINPLINALQDEDGSIRYLAIYCLGEFGDGRALILLSNLDVGNNQPFKKAVSEAINLITARVT